MVCQYYFVQSSDVQETLRVYDEIHAQNTVTHYSSICVQYYYNVMYVLPDVI